MNATAVHILVGGRNRNRRILIKLRSWHRPAEIGTIQDIRWEHVPVRRDLTGIVAWHKKLGSENTSMKLTAKRMRATSGLAMSQVKVSPQDGFNPISPEGNASQGSRLYKAREENELKRIW